MLLDNVRVVLKFIFRDLILNGWVLLLVVKVLLLFIVIVW